MLLINNVSVLKIRCINFSGQNNNFSIFVKLQLCIQEDIHFVYWSVYHFSSVNLFVISLSLSSEYMSSAMRLFTVHDQLLI
jgi:hypothetical protein